MPDYRNVKKPIGLIGVKLSKDEQAIVDGGGNAAAIGTDVSDAKHPSQLDLWYQDNKTLIAGKRDGKTIASWSLKGFISPEDCRKWFLASIPAKVGETDG